MMNRERVNDAASVVARRNSLTPGHGTREFKRMTIEVVEQLQPDIDAEIDAKTEERLKAERERIAAILDAPQAKGREATAQRLALASEVSLESAIEILSTTPKTGLRGRTPLDVAMQSQTETVNADDGTENWTDEDHAVNALLNAGE
jgi:phage I-like protein